MTTKTEILNTLRSRYDALVAFVDTMPNNGEYVISLDDGSVLYPNGGINDAGMLCPISPDGKYLKFETAQKAYRRLSYLKEINSSNNPLRSGFVCREGIAYEYELWSLKALMIKLTGVAEKVS